MTQNKPRIRKTPHGRHAYTATVKGFGTYGWGDTPDAARAKLAEMIEKSGEQQTVGEYPEIVTADNSAHEIAIRKAQHGHKTWLCFRRRDGSWVARLYNADAVKAALLAVGTQGRFYWYSANSGTPNLCRSWHYGLHLLKCAKGAERRGYSAA